MKRTWKDWLLILASGSALLWVLAFMGALFVPFFSRGLDAVNLEFVVSSEPNVGIFPAIYGTVMLTLLMTLLSVPIGIATAIYLSEYTSRSSRAARWIRFAVNNLAGVPSIVFGLFGLGFFVLFVGKSVDQLAGHHEQPIWGRPSVLWAACTLAVLSLPVIIVAADEAIRSVPKELREASLGLGATTLQTVFRVVLPHAKAGILTGAILAVSRGAGEVAPILFTGVADYLPEKPVHLSDMFMHLGHHIYVLATQSPDVERAHRALYGTAFVLVLSTFALNLIATILRSQSRKAER